MPNITTIEKQSGRIENDVRKGATDAVVQGANAITGNVARIIDKRKRQDAQLKMQEASQKANQEASALIADADKSGDYEGLGERVEETTKSIVGNTASSLPDYLKDEYAASTQQAVVEARQLGESAAAEGRAVKQKQILDTTMANLSNRAIVGNTPLSMLNKEYETSIKSLSLNKAEEDEALRVGKESFAYNRIKSHIKQGRGDEYIKDLSKGVYNDTLTPVHTQELLNLSKKNKNADNSYKALTLDDLSASKDRAVQGHDNIRDQENSVSKYTSIRDDLSLAQQSKGDSDVILMAINKNLYNSTNQNDYEKVKGRIRNDKSLSPSQKKYIETELDKASEARADQVLNDFPTYANNRIPKEDRTQLYLADPILQKGEFITTLNRQIANANAVANDGGIVKFDLLSSKDVKETSKRLNAAQPEDIVDFYKDVQASVDDGSYNIVFENFRTKSDGKYSVYEASAKIFNASTGHQGTALSILEGDNLLRKQAPVVKTIDDSSMKLTKWVSDNNVSNVPGITRYMETGKRIAYKLASEGASTPDAIERGMEMAFGQLGEGSDSTGGVYKKNGAILPVNRTKDDFDDIVNTTVSNDIDSDDGIDAHSVTKLSDGRYVRTTASYPVQGDNPDLRYSQKDFKRIINNGKLVTVKDGVYSVMYNDKQVVNSTGNVYYFSLKANELPENYLKPTKDRREGFELKAGEGKAGNVNDVKANVGFKHEDIRLKDSPRPLEESMGKFKSVYF